MANPCGEPNCRVCRALGFIAKSTRRGHRRHPVAEPLPGTHHPLSTQAALDRADQIHAWMVAYQAENNGPPRSLLDVADGVGLKSAGLVWLYMKRLEVQGRAHRIPVRGRGRHGTRWEALCG